MAGTLPEQGRTRSGRLNTSDILRTRAAHDWELTLRVSSVAGSFGAWRTMAVGFS
jgi:hypothetical protein